MTQRTSISVYCGASSGTDSAYLEAAHELGNAIAAAGHGLIYGGGHVGLMGILADAALSAGGHVTGVIPRFLIERELGHGGVSELIVVEDMHDRKRRMFDLADAFVILPGGLGTLEEMFEVLTWRQLSVHQKPIVVANISGYWTPLGALIQNIVDQGFAHADTAALYTMVDGVADVLAALDIAEK